MYAQFGPGKFPANWWTVVGCVAAYCIISLVLNVYLYYFENDACLLTKPCKVGSC